MSTIEVMRDARGVVTLGMARPQAKNALDLDMVARLRDALTEAERTEARVVVLRSQVPGVFSLGMDLVALSKGISEGATSPQVHEAVRKYADLLKQILALRCVTIAEVGGMAVGGGVDLLSSCDLAFASSDAAFSVAQLRKGIFPLTTSGVVIPRIGQREFLYWMLSGQNWSAERARKMGLVNAVFAPGDLGRQIGLLVDKILGYDAAALRLGIDALRLAPELTQLQRLEHLGALLALNAQIPRKS